MAGTEEPRVTGLNIHADRECEDPTTHQHAPNRKGPRFYVRMGNTALHLDDDYAERLVIMLQAARNGEFTEPHEQSFESDTLGAATE